MGHKRTEFDFPPPKPTSITVWKNDVTIGYAGGGNGGGGERSDITELSKKSLLRMAFVAHNTDVAFQVMVTLTYPKNYPSDGKKVKYQLKRFIQWLRRKAGVASHFWFLEFQRRGAPHFHIFTAGGNVLNMKQAVSETWYNIVASGDDKHLKAGTRVERLRRPDAAGRYAAKYASKPYQKKVPESYQDVGRFWGHSRDVEPSPIGTRPLEGWGDLALSTEGWEYHEKVMNRRTMSTLYNAADIVLKNARIDDEEI